MTGRYEPNGVLESFKTNDKSIVKDDIVVVPNSTRHGFTTVKIEEADAHFDPTSNEEVRWIAGRVDMTQHKADLSAEENALGIVQRSQARKAREKLRADLMGDQQASQEIADLQSAQQLAPPDDVTE